MDPKELNILNLITSTLQKASSHWHNYIFFTRNLKARSQLLYKMTSFTKFGIVHSFTQLLWLVVGSRKPAYHTSWMTVVTPTDRPKSVRNRCIIEDFGGVFVLVHDFSVSDGMGGFIIGWDQIQKTPVRTPGVLAENTSSVSPACRKRRLKGRRYIAIVADTA